MSHVTETDGDDGMFTPGKIPLYRNNSFFFSLRPFEWNYASLVVFPLFCNPPLGHVHLFSIHMEQWVMLLSTVVEHSLENDQNSPLRL